MLVGNIKLKNNLIAAPMAGISDQPFRSICLEKGAGQAIAEMTSCNPDVWLTVKSKNRMNIANENGIKWIQIAGSDPAMMGDAARYNADLGANIIDINMGCPAKKVNKKLAGSALMQDVKLAQKIITQVVNSTEIPITLKMRTGWNRDNKNALEIAKIAEDCGIKAITIHGRTRADMFKGEAEYETIKTVKKNIKIPIIANGDINTPEQAEYVLEYTNADAIMIGRSAQGNPWIFKNIEEYLTNKKKPSAPTAIDFKETLLKHLLAIYKFYGEDQGVLFARKHINWYLKKQNKNNFKMEFNKIKTIKEQHEFLLNKLQA